MVAHLFGRVFLAAVLCFLVLFGSVTWAQVPPHQPGEICFTEKFWCWAQPPGQPGAACMCGAVPGTLG